MALPGIHLPSSVIIYPTKTRFTVRATTQSSSSSSSSSPSEAPKPANGGTQEGSSVSSTPRSTSNRTGVGFGSSSSSSNSSVDTKDNKKRQRTRSRERAPVVRRTPIEKPAFLSEQGGTRVEKRSPSETAFLYTWLGLGCVILAEGLTLSASGFLPEEWDKFLVNYLYPSFSPTVLFFLAGTVVYGVLKYGKEEKSKS